MSDDLRNERDALKAELAKLKARIAEAPLYTVPTHKPKTAAEWLEVIGSVKALNAMRGERVRLLVEEVDKREAGE